MSHNHIATSRKGLPPLTADNPLAEFYKITLIQILIILRQMLELWLETQLHLDWWLFGRIVGQIHAAYLKVEYRN